MGISARHAGAWAAGLTTTGLVCTLLVTSLGASAATGAAGEARQLQRDADAVRDAGAVGLLAELRTPDGESVKVRSGSARLGSEELPPQDSPIRAGSVTKTFTATVVLQLVGEGKLSLEDTVHRWLPGVVKGNGNDGRRITVRQLLQHTSGMGQTFNTPGEETAEEHREHRYDTHSLKELVALAMEHPPNNKPGAVHEYSNTNYFLAAMIVEKVTGNLWDYEITRRITVPLRLKDTYAPGNNPFLPRPHMKLYREFEEGEGWTDTTERNLKGKDGEGSLVSTTTDLNRFFQALIGGELLRPAELAEMQKTVPHPEYEEEWGLRYGLGLKRMDLDCGGYYWTHWGDVLGASTRGGVTSDGERSVVIHTSGNGDHLAVPLEEKALRPMVQRALCGTDD